MPEIELENLNTSYLSSSETLQRATQILEQEVQKNLLWNYHAHSGPYYVCKYFLMCDWMDIKTDPAHNKNLTNYLIENRLPDGSWQQVLEKNHSKGDWNTTLLAYWYLKTQNIDHKFLEPSLRYLKEKNIYQSANIVSKYLLAIFGQISWNRITPLPSLLFFEKFPLGYRRFAQWVIPNLLPLAILKEVKISRLPTKNHSLHELTSSFDQVKPTSKLQLTQQIKVNWLKEKILREQSKLGGWGGYAHATLFSLAALHSVDQKSFKSVKKKALEFIDNLYFSDPQSIGRTCDGSHWDTLLALEALQASTHSTLGLKKLILNLIQKADPKTGALGFGLGFEEHPDIDDTSRLLKLAFTEKINPNCFQQKALNWILQQQNTDGGWGALSKNNYPSGLLKKVFGSFLDAATLFDESCADSTGTVLLTLSCFKNEPRVQVAIQKAAHYLKKSQHPYGYWIGRWAINSIFGTSMCVRGLTACGFSSQDGFIRKSLDWLSQKQNSDGGFGESSESYVDPHWIARGKSTPTQTAWAAHALISDQVRYAHILDKCEEYLIKSFNTQLGWQDKTVVGTGHPGTFYFIYPSYARVFPILFLSSKYQQTPKPTHN